MNPTLRLLAFASLSAGSLFVNAQEPAPPTGIPPAEVPEPLQGWIPWVRHGLPGAASIPLHNNTGERIVLWPSRLKLNAGAAGASFSFEVEAFAKGWLALPGGPGSWPMGVMLNGQPAPVLEREKRPAVHLEPGRHVVEGTFAWSELPQQIKLPPQAGLLALTVNGQVQPAPSWEADGTLWLQRQASAEAADQDFLSLKIHSLLSDGNPMWLETRIELLVAGKSREEVFGSVLPEGWQLASVESPLPVAIDEAGLLKGQVRAGRWTVVLRAFRNTPAEKVAFAAGARPAAADQTLAFQAAPDFRQAELTGLPQIDAGQTQAPQEWRSYPLYRWDAKVALGLAERVRGPGQRGVSPIVVERQLWLDEDGRGITFRDTLTASTLREIRRLDAVPGHQLGSVTVSGEPQLITANPATGDPGFEARGASLKATATGRIPFNRRLSAAGWKTHVEGLGATLHLPPGYRMFAIFGADGTQGDWLSAWSLLDLFLLLLFTLAVVRLRGRLAGVLALTAFALAYHEPGAPRFTWLLLLLPVALTTLLPPGRASRTANGFKWAAFVFLLLFLAPFLGRQVQAVIYPQLERVSDRSWAGLVAGGVSSSLRGEASRLSYDGWEQDAMPAKKVYDRSADNLKADPKAVIQTGPGVPAWQWRMVTFWFDGPVAEGQTLRPILIPPGLSRLFGIARVLCLVLLAAVLARTRRRGPAASAPVPGAVGAAASSSSAVLLAVLALLGAPEAARAQFPEQHLLDELKGRLAETSDAFPGAADLASADLVLQGDAVTLTLAYHAAARCAVPLPVPLAAWGVVSAALDGEKPAALLRRDGLLWTLLPEKGIHTLTLTARLRDLNEWEWGFPVRPRRASVKAGEWTVSGLRPDGRVEEQILFYRVARGESATAAYDRPDTRHALRVDRRIEMGLVWRVTTTVRRLSPAGRATALRIPLLPGEKVLSAGRTAEGGSLEVHLAPGSTEAAWESELAPVNELVLATRPGDTWTEQWRLAVSPVWNVKLSGLAPVLETVGGQPASFWQPWPGERATLSVSRPAAVPGAVVTIDRVQHELCPGRRQRSASLYLSLRTSLGEDFPIRLPADADITSLKHDGSFIPIRREGDAVIIPLRPGSQAITMEWRRPGDASFRTRAETVVLPVEAANVTTIIRPSEDRWVLAAHGPLLGPAVRFWGVLAFALLSAVALSRVPHSPLTLVEWTLLSIGLTQIGVVGALFVIGWIFFLRWRGSPGFQQQARFTYNLCSLALFGMTLVVIGLFIGIAAAGLLGNPDMYIIGNGSHESYLAWYTARSAAELPVPGYTSVSVWGFRLAMLLWALWLASALVRWLRLMWKSSSTGGHFRKKARPAKKAGG